MLLHLAVCFINVLFVTSFVVPESYNIILKDSGEFKVDDSIDASDYDMVGKDQRSENLEDKETNLDYFNRLASKEKQITTTAIRGIKRRRYTSPRRRHRNTIPLTFSPSLNDYWSFNHAGTGRDEIWYVDGLHPDLTHMLPFIPWEHVKWIQAGEPKGKLLRTKQPVENSAVLEDVQPNYDYNDMLKEYVEESLEESKSDQTYEASKEKYNNDLMQSLEKILPIDAISALTRIKRQNGTNPDPKSKSNIKDGRDTKVLVEKLWRFIKILLIVYVILTIPMWCTKGWCCCCLCCKMFKPHKTIAAAKIYMIRNPPGVHTSKDRQKHYEPTEVERYSYEQLEHLIRTM